MGECEIPNFGELLAPWIGRVPEGLVPLFLAGLERGAAGRYRGWADACGDAEQRKGLLACADREDEIATRVEALFPADAEARARVEAPLPDARRAYLGVFEPLPVRDQYRVQADAERQGAAAWRSLAAAHPEAAVREVLEGCALLEEESAAFLDGLAAG